MVVALSSLRVTSDFDASAYVRGAGQKVSADQQMIAADRARNTSLAQADAALAKVVPGMAALSKSLLDGYGTGQQFEAQVRKIANAVDRGMGLDRANALLEGAYKKFGLTADAAALAEQGYVSIAGAVEQLNAKLAIQARLSDQLGATAQRSGLRSSLDAQFGIGATDNSAARAADVAALGVSLDNLRAKYSPLFAAQRDYKASLDELRSVEARAALTEAERAAAIQRTKEAFAQQVVGIRNAGKETDNFGRSTSSAANKLNQLSYQVNDIVGGLMSGQSPMMILAQQGTQVSQIWTGASKTVTGALLAIGGVTVVAGVVGAAQAISKVRTELAELAETSRRMNMSTSVMQQLAGAASYGGVKDFATDATTLAMKLNEAGVHANDLSKFLAVNGVSIKDAKGEVIGLDTALERAAVLVRDARTELDKIRIVEALGLSREWVRVLENGPAALRDAREQAALAGATIDAELIARAEQFDREWDRSMTNLSLRWKSFAAETGDAFSRIAREADRGAKDVDSYLTPLIEKWRKVNPLIDFVTAGALLPKIALSPKPAPVATGLSPMERIQGGFGQIELQNKSGGTTKLLADVEKLEALERQRISTLGGMASVQDVVRSKMLELDNAARDGVSITREQRAAILDLTREQALGITAMKQQADATRIQAETLGMSAGKAAEYSAIQTRLAEAMRNRQVLTEQDIEQIKRQAAALGEVVQAAERARVLQDIRFGAQTALLSPEDVQIAQQLKGLYPDVATALSSVEASALRTNGALSSISSSLSGTLTTGLTDIADGTKSISQGAADMQTAVVRALEEMIIKLMIVGPLMKGLQAGFSMLGIGGAGSPMSILPSATGNVFAGNVIPFRKGGAFTDSVVSAPTLFKFANGGAMSLGLMGEAGPEAVMPLRRGSDGRLGIEAAGGGSRSSGSITVNVNNAPAGSTAAVDRKVNPDGSASIDVTLKKLVDSAVGDSLSSGTGQRVLGRQYGVKQFMGG